MRTTIRRKHYLRNEKKAVIWKRIIAYNIFKDYLYDGNFSEFMKRLKKHENIVICLWAYHKDNSMFSNPRYMKRKERIRWGWKEDDRSGEEIYGYPNIEKIEGTLSYISDRFNCQMRLRWLLDLIKWSKSQ